MNAAMPQSYSGKVKLATSFATQQRLAKTACSIEAALSRSEGELMMRLC
jgi:hypothetical protein